MARILTVGIATLDIINETAAFPHEDDEVRALAQQKRRGGNAANTSTVLAQLGCDSHWAGVLVDEPDAQVVVDELDCYGVGYAHCRRLNHGKMPTSYVTLNRANGSRTIVHYRDLPEFNFEDFLEVDLSAFDWLHFEGRNVSETLKMLSHVRAHYPDLPCSLEMEKTRDGIEALTEKVQYVFYSKVYAQARGFDCGQRFLNAVDAPDQVQTVTWGAQGAYAMAEGVLYRSEALSPKHIVDTLGAGDTFNAGMIYALTQHTGLPQALNFACRLAGEKCAVRGFDLREVCARLLT